MPGHYCQQLPHNIEQWDSGYCRYLQRDFLAALLHTKRLLASCSHLTNSQSHQKSGHLASVVEAIDLLARWWAGVATVWRQYRTIISQPNDSSSCVATQRPPGGLSPPDYGQAEEQGRVQNFMGEAPASNLPFFSLSEDPSIATVCTSGIYSDLTTMNSELPSFWLL